MKTYVLFCDGASRGNPGDAAIGVSLTDGEGNEVATISQRLGKATNNEAEWKALVEGLKLALEKKCKALEVRADSELVVRQMEGRYKVKHPNLKPFFQEARMLSEKFESFKIRHIPREENSRADELGNLALDS